MRVVSPADLDLAADAIESGALVIVPTDRWYMICCDAGNQNACNQIFSAKRRQPDKSLLLLTPSAEDAHRWFSVTSDAERLIEAFWPGNLALLLPWRDPTDATRYPAVGDKEALSTNAPGVLGNLARRATCRIAATSVNISGSDGTTPAISLPEVEDFLAQSQADVAMTIDGGVCPVADHLTIVRCVLDETEVVREGIVHIRAIMAAVNSSAPTQQPERAAQAPPRVEAPNVRSGTS